MWHRSACGCLRSKQRTSIIKKFYGTIDVMLYSNIIAPLQKGGTELRQGIPAAQVQLQAPYFSWCKKYNSFEYLCPSSTTHPAVLVLNSAKKTHRQGVIDVHWKGAPNVNLSAQEVCSRLFLLLVKFRLSPFLLLGNKFLTKPTTVKKRRHRKILNA
jgi:hypothetical protein